MKINENLKNNGKIVKTHHKKLISAPNHHQTTTVAFFISSVIQFDKDCHLMVLYGNYHVCIFMNINENLISEGKTIA